MIHTENMQKHTHTQTKVQKAHRNSHRLTLAADLNWARQGLGGRAKQDRKYSSQMERWRGQRAGGTGERCRNKKKERVVGKRGVRV